MRVAAIVPAAGAGVRLKSKIQKPYINLGKKPILARTLIALSKNKNIKEILVSVGKDKEHTLEHYMRSSRAKISLIEAHALHFRKNPRRQPVQVIETWYAFKFFQKTPLSPSSTTTPY